VTKTNNQTGIKMNTIKLLIALFIAIGALSVILAPEAPVVEHGHPYIDHHHNRGI